LQWLLASDTELVKLVETTRTICPVHFAASPPTYFNPIPKEKWSPSSLSIPGPLRSLTSDVDRRVRGTAGGDRLDSSCPPSTHVASLPCVNLLLNSVVSTDAFFGSVDLTDFYLGTDLSSPQYIKLFTHLFSHSVLSHLNLLPFIKSPPESKPFLLFRIDKTMYGLKEAGKLSQLRLISHLAAHGFFETTTPCLFRHVSRPITFVLVVDDFGVKYHHQDDFAYLVSILSLAYHCKAHPVSSKFLGFSIHHNRSSRSLSLSYPGYIATLLTRLRPNGVTPTASPTIYTPPPTDPKPPNPSPALTSPPRPRPPK